MKPGDYIERERITQSGRMVTDKIVISTTGVEYVITKQFAKGGVAKVYKARRLSDKKECVFKEYVPSPENLRMHNAIKRNIQNLINKPLTENDGTTPLKSFVGPIDEDSLIDLPQSQSFGYIMELVDTKSFLQVPQLWHRDRYPDALTICKACINIADFFRSVHFKGWCYKDINEGNIYINNKTGDIRVIDCDNINVQARKTIKGTDGYMAPEVYVTSMPDIYTDYFSMAVLFYRLIVGGYPMDGKQTRQYLLDKNLSMQEAASTIYGSEALFAFDPRNNSNEIRNLVDPLNPYLYELQTKKWDRLPIEIKEMFCKTFSTGLANTNRNRRATDKDWKMLFETLKDTGLVKCKCGKWNFGDKKIEVECNFCKAKLSPLRSVRTLSKQPNSTAELTTVTFRAKRDTGTSLDIVAKRKHLLQGREIYTGLNEGWMKIEYSKAKNMLSAVNLSNYTWIISDGGNKQTCVPGGRVVLKKGLVIIVLKRQLQLKVTEIK